MTHTINVPKPFPTDTPEQQAQAMYNYFTHRFSADDGDIRCVDCDCRSTHKASHYPCGQEPPRLLRTLDDAGKIVSEVEVDVPEPPSDYGWVTEWEEEDKS